MAKIKATKTKEIEKKEDTKVKKIKNKKILSEGEEEFRRFIIILIIMLLIAAGIYIISSILVDKRSTDEEQTEVEISYDQVNVGMILNRPYDEYYVIAYDSTDPDAMIYSAIITNYTYAENSKKIYFCDLDDYLNRDYVSSTGEGNSNAKEVSEFSFGNITLLYIKDGKVKSYIDDLDKIKSTLK